MSAHSAVINAIGKVVKKIVPITEVIPTSDVLHHGSRGNTDEQANRDRINYYRAQIRAGHEKDMEPITVHGSTPPYLVSDGHHRLRALKMEGKKQVPVQILSQDDMRIRGPIRNKLSSPDWAT
jgi:ParB/Sulfiredoxin domain